MAQSAAGWGSKRACKQRRANPRNKHVRCRREGLVELLEFIVVAFARARSSSSGSESLCEVCVCVPNQKSLCGAVRPTLWRMPGSFRIPELVQRQCVTEDQSEDRDIEHPEA
eukprot:6455794-Amphidinium_carterae.2